MCATAGCHKCVKEIAKKCQKNLSQEVRPNTVVVYWRYRKKMLLRAAWQLSVMSRQPNMQCRQAGSTGAPASCVHGTSTLLARDWVKETTSVAAGWTLQYLLPITENLIFNWMHSHLQWPTISELTEACRMRSRAIKKRSSRKICVCIYFLI